MAGIPVVTTNVGSVPEIVLDGITGIVTDLDVHKIADAIEKLVNSSDLRAQLSVAAQNFTLANFGVERLVNDHEALYKRLLASRAKS
jgi:glycosyltransferase involved in cell wall biosynthesis